MKKSTKENIIAIIGVAILFGLVVFEGVKAIDAWDNTMTDEEIEYYLEKYPDSKKLNKMAEERNLQIISSE